MGKRDVYCMFFESENDARIRCSTRNRAARRANNYRDIYCLVDGPDNDYAVVDLPTAIDLGQGYEVCD